MPKPLRKEASLETALGTYVNSELGPHSYLKAGDQGWPDRLILLPGGKHFWVEFKTPKGRLRPAQVALFKVLTTRGDRVFVVKSTEELDAVIGAIKIAKLQHDLMTK